MAAFFKSIKVRNEEIPALTGIRFLAVSMIFLLHYTTVDKFGVFWNNVFNQLFLGVHLFFILSGFLICYIYSDKARLDKKFLTVFFTKRIARIYPLYFLTTTFVFIVNYIQGHTEHWLPLYLVNITFTKGFSSWYMFTGIFQTWSLTVEETFYALAPFIFLVIKRKNILFGQVIFFYVAGVLLWLFFKHFPFKGLFSSGHFIAMVTFFGRCLEFYLGIWLALYVKKHSLLARPPKPAGWYTYAGLSGMIAVIFCLSFFTKEQMEQVGSYICIMLLRNVAFPLTVILFFYGLITEKSVVKQFFSSRLSILLGRSSYAFFLIHTGIFVSWIYEYITTSVLGIYIGTYILSIILFFCVEQPLRNIVNKWGGQKAVKQEQ